jgi:hypothetical protein
MKKKVLISILVIFLVLILIGCNPIPPGLPEEAMAEQEVYSYWQAITNRQYELAKWHCIPDGIWYNKVDEWEEYININSEGEASVLIPEPYFHKQTEVIGNNAIVYVTIFVNKIPFPGSFTTYSDVFEYEIGLIKETSPPGKWKLK